MTKNMASGVLWMPHTIKLQSLKKHKKLLKNLFSFHPVAAVIDVDEVVVPLAMNAFCGCLSYQGLKLFRRGSKLERLYQ
jgi:hypothetical protein